MSSAREAPAEIGAGAYSDVHAGLTAVWINPVGASWPEEIDPPPAVVTSLDELADLLSIETE